MIYNRGYPFLPESRNKVVCFESDIENIKTFLTANNQLFQIQLHQMFEVVIKLFFRESSEKFRLGSSVDFANVVYQLPFVHTSTSFKTGNLRSSAAVASLVSFSVGRNTKPAAQPKTV
jgi:hypothetical protein